MNKDESGKNSFLWKAKVPMNSDVNKTQNEGTDNVSLYCTLVLKFKRFGLKTVKLATDF